MHAFKFWGLKVRLLKKYDRVAGTMDRGEECGMAASNDDENKVIGTYPLDTGRTVEELEDAVHD